MKTPVFMKTSSNGNIFRATGPLEGESTGDRWIPLTKDQWRGALMFSLICACTNGWDNDRDASDLRRHSAHYDVTVMMILKLSLIHGVQSSDVMNKNIEQITSNLYSDLVIGSRACSICTPADQNTKFSATKWRHYTIPVYLGKIPTN